MINNLHFYLADLMTKIEMNSVMATLTNEVNSAHDKAYFNFIELNCLPYPRSV